MPSSWDMDGPAFYASREALDSMRGLKTPTTRIQTPSEWLDIAINTIYELTDDIMARWSNEQWEAVHVYEREKTYQAAGEVLGITLQGVEKRCKTAKWPLVRKTELAIAELAKYFERSLST